jgi:hypothetical protein
VRKIVEFLNKEGCDDGLRNKQLIVVNDDVFWIQNDWSDMPSAIRSASNKGRDIGQYALLVIPPLIQIVQEIWQAAEKSEVIDLKSFQQRAKARAT